MSVEQENPARRPYLARGAGIERCPRCRVPVQSCICEHLGAAVETGCEFWLLMHHNEFYKPTNTGKLIEACIARTRVFEWSRTEPPADLIAALADPAYRPMIVFPEAEDYAERMVHNVEMDGRIPVFIILDGTWRQARRMFRHSRYLQDLPVIQPQTDRVSSYTLRRSTVAEHLCTAEVAIALLEQMGEEQGGAALENYFSHFNDNYFATRRKWDRETADTAVSE